MFRPAGALEEARRAGGLSISELWLRYFELGGMSSPLELEAVLQEALVPSRHDRDVIAVALNERLSELGRDHPIPYSGDQS